MFRMEPGARRARPVHVESGFAEKRSAIRTKAERRASRPGQEKRSATRTGVPIDLSTVGKRGRLFRMRHTHEARPGSAPIRLAERERERDRERQGQGKGADGTQDFVPIKRKTVRKAKALLHIRPLAPRCTKQRGPNMRKSFHFINRWIKNNLYFLIRQQIPEKRRVPPNRFKFIYISKMASFFALPSYPLPRPGVLTRSFC